MPDENSIFPKTLGVKIVPAKPLLPPYPPDNRFPLPPFPPYKGTFPPPPTPPPAFTNIVLIDLPDESVVTKEIALDPPDAAPRTPGPKYPAPPAPTVILHVNNGLKLNNDPWDIPPPPPPPAEVKLADDFAFPPPPPPPTIKYEKLVEGIFKLYVVLLDVGVANI